MPPSAPDARPLAGFLLLVLLSVSPSVQAPAAKEEPQITSALRPKASIGAAVRVRCEGRTSCPESAIMYWLANGTFVDQLYPDGAVKEEATKEEGSELTRELVFSALTAQDLRTTFTCLITDPAGVAQRRIEWDRAKTEKGSGCAGQDA